MHMGRTGAHGGRGSRPASGRTSPGLLLLAVLAGACTSLVRAGPGKVGGGEPSTSAGTAAGTGGGSSSSTTSTSASTGAGSTTSGSSSWTSWTAGETGWDDPSCDPWAQDCPPGEKCMPYSNDGGGTWNAVGCFPVDPDPKDYGEECTMVGSPVSGMDDCKLGAMCWDVDPETLKGYCIPQCSGPEYDPTCPEGYACYLAGSSILTPCFRTCDLFIQDCPQGELCFLPTYSSAEPVCIFDASNGEAPAGTPCEYANDCNPGLRCASRKDVPGCQGSTGCCSPYCDLSDPNADATCDAAFDTPGAICVALFKYPEYAPEDFTHVGVCTTPP